MSTALIREHIRTAMELLKRPPPLPDTRLLTLAQRIFDQMSPEEQARYIRESAQELW